MANATNKVFSGQEFSPTDFAVMMENVSPSEVGVLNGCECTLSSTSEISVSAGYIIVYGRLLYVDGGAVAVTLPASASIGHIVAPVDLSNSAVGAIFVTYDMSEYTTSDNFNLNNGQAYVEIGWLDATSSGITAVRSRALLPTGDDCLKIRSSSPATTTSDITIGTTSGSTTLLSITLEPGTYIINGYVWVNGVSGGTGTTTIALVDTTTNTALRYEQEQHSVNAQLCMNITAFLTIGYINTSHDRDYTETVALKAWASSSGRVVSKGHCALTCIRLK